MNTYEKIKTLRKQKGFSQSELARLTGYSDRSSIAKIESGNVDLSESKILLFAKALDVSPSYLMGLNDMSGAMRIEDISEVSMRQQLFGKPALTDSEKQLLLDYRDSSEEIREEAAGMLHRSAERNRKDARSSPSAG